MRMYLHERRREGAVRFIEYTDVQQSVSNRLSSCPLHSYTLIIAVTVQATTISSTTLSGIRHTELRLHLQRLERGIGSTDLG